MKFGPVDITAAEAVYFNFGDDRGEVEIGNPVSIYERADGAMFVKSADGYVTMVAPGWLSADIVPRSDESVSR